MRRALVLGSRGFLGRHLVRRLRERGIEVVGGIRPGGRAPGDGSPGGAPVVECDILDRRSLAAALATVAPTEVYHLAGWIAREDPLGGLASNLAATGHLLEAIVAGGRRMKVLIPGSAAEYGPVDPACFPVTEDCPLAPLTLYGVGKAAQAMLAARYARVHDVPVYWVRPFNVTGPDEPPLTVCSQLARQVAAIEAGLLAPRLETATLDTSRDFVDVRDVARALEVVVEHAQPGVYNICSGVETSIQTVVDLLRELGTANWNIVAVPGGRRPDDVARQRGSYERLERATGWTPTIPLRESLSALRDAWRETLASEGTSAGARAT
jgi:GDP-4-dehydro-6-deoxy-D-mannose reductase